MGGSAFTPEGLSTPRMPAGVYTSVLARMEGLLRAHFKYVGHALEAPAKTSYGDIDILVAEPLSVEAYRSEPRSGEFLATVLGAEKWKRTGGAGLFSLAVKWPQDLEVFGDADNKAVVLSPNTRGEANVAQDENEVVVSANPRGEAHVAQDDTDAELSLANLSLDTTKYIQVDITICPTESRFTWHLFSHAHGDMWNILGGIIRRHGLTCTPRGLFLRIAEVETHNKEQARVKMTDDPTNVLEYLGLEVERYWKPFGSWDEMMAYVATCRFHDPGRWKEKNTASGDETGGSVMDAAGNAKGTAGKVMSTTENEKCTAEMMMDATKTETQTAEKKTGEEKRLPLKANDRQRAVKRPVFGYWINEYLPKHHADPPGKDAYLSREQVVDDAKRYFGPDFARRFEDRLTLCVRQIKVDQVWADIRKSLPVEGVEIGYVMKGMKREIAGDPDQDGLEGVRSAYVEGRFEDVLQWATENWKDVGERQKSADQEKSHAHLLEMRKRDREKEQEKERQLDCNPTPHLNAAQES